MMTPLRVLIVDDEACDCELLRYHLKRAAPDAQILAELHSASAATHRLGQNDYDVVFLDVQLPDGNGFDLVPFVRVDSAIIFVSGRDDHAVRAFEVNALDYIVKPVSTKRLAEALTRTARARGATPSSLAQFNDTDRIFLRGGAARGRFVSVNDIVAICSSENYCEVRLVDGEKWLVRQTMQAWEQSLPRSLFARVHRNAIVNLSRVERIERTADETTSLHLQGIRQPLPVGRRLWSGLKARLTLRDPPT